MTVCRQSVLPLVRSILLLPLSLPPKARSLWLLGVCGQNLTNADLWCGAYQLVVQHMASKDLVVSIRNEGMRGRPVRVWETE